jgi:hypothetical protein
MLRLGEVAGASVQLACVIGRTDLHPPADGGIAAGSDLLFLVRANGVLAPVTHASTWRPGGAP